MYYDDHNPPHFHATYGENEALLTIDTLTILRGALPTRALRLVEEWAQAHLEELAADWQKARAGEPIPPIAPLS